MTTPNEITIEEILYLNETYGTTLLIEDGSVKEIIWINNSSEA